MKYKILFVDDCSTSLLMEQVLLANCTECDLIRACHGWEAVQKAQAEQPDLILMDGTLRSIDSCRQIRKMQDLQRVPILMVTTFGGPSNIENGFVGGDSDNPATSPKWRGLLEMVNTYLASHSVNR
ncbi:MAG TPA: response regulator [Alphaproteobacteria bacterium]|nr:response regulator [Alphaproteobacteria bacterium]